MKDRPRFFNNENPDEKSLLNEHLQALVSKLNILRSFSVATPDISLAEQVTESMENETSMHVETIFAKGSIESLNLAKLVNSDAT